MAGMVFSVSFRTILSASVRLRYCVGSRGRYFNNSYNYPQNGSYLSRHFHLARGFTSLQFYIPRRYVTPKYENIYIFLLMSTHYTEASELLSLLKLLCS